MDMRQQKEDNKKENTQHEELKGRHEKDIVKGRQ